MEMWNKLVMRITIIINIIIGIRSHSSSGLCSGATAAAALTPCQPSGIVVCPSIHPPPLDCPPFLRSLSSRRMNEFESQSITICELGGYLSSQSDWPTHPLTGFHVRWRRDTRIVWPERHPNNRPLINPQSCWPNGPQRK